MLSNSFQIFVVIFGMIVSFTAGFFLGVIYGARRIIGEQENE